MDLLHAEWLGNPLGTWLTALGAGLAAAVALRVAVPFLIRRGRRLARSTRTYVDDSLVAAAEATRGFLYVVAGLFVTARLLSLPAPVESALDEVLYTAVLVQLGMWVAAGYRAALAHYKRDRYAGDAAALTSFQMFHVVGTAIIWFFVAVFALQIWGVNVTALITGLGIGGIAVALAVQSILSDLFASLSIIFDKPFLVGDFLTVGEYMGTVESIGMKTTLLRSISGEQVVFSNGDLLASRIRNFGRMEERRAVFTFGIEYESDPDAVAAVPDWVRAIIEDEERTRFERCHLKRLGDSALEYEAVYYVVVPDYRAYMDVQERINLALLRRLAAEGVSLAYPTQRVQVDGITLREAPSGSGGAGSGAVDDPGPQV